VRINASVAFGTLAIEPAPARSSPVWPMHQSGRIVDRIVQGNLLANNGETVRRMAIAGAGIARLTFISMKTKPQEY
jgi:hypothetical protein